MKRKIISVLLCVALLLTLSVNVSADTAVDVTQPITDTQMMPVTDEITVNVGEGGGAVITEPIAPIDSDISLTATGTVPVGYLDTVNYNTIGGWAYQSNIPNTALYVHIYITNNSTGAQTIYTTLANVYRSDLAAAGYGNGYHGFHYDVSWLTFVPGTYTVKAYAIGVDSPINPQLTNTKTFTVRAPQYNIEYITSNYVEGWIWKPDVPNDPLAVHIYVYKSNGTLCGTYTGMANRYRSDLQNAGKGNGEHGFRIYIDFNSLPEERLTIKIHYVDNSGYHPVFYTGYYENRMPITLLGMIESLYKHDLSEWMWSDDVVQYCENIGCSDLRRYNYASNSDYTYSYTRFIKESSYCAIFTHGTEDGESIESSMYNIYNYDKPNNGYGYYGIEHLNELDDDYFAKTRCVVLMSCYAGLRGESNPNNFVNTLQRKGVWTVVGFTDSITYTYDDKDTDDTMDDTVITDRSAQQWIIEFNEHLGLGESVKEAAASARKQISNDWGYAKLVEWGLEENKCYIAGDENQIVKH